MPSDKHARGQYLNLSKGKTTQNCQIEHDAPSQTVALVCPILSYSIAFVSSAARNSGAHVEDIAAGTPL